MERMWCPRPTMVQGRAPRPEVRRARRRLRSKCTPRLVVPSPLRGGDGLAWLHSKLNAPLKSVLGLCTDLQPGGYLKEQDRQSLPTTTQHPLPHPRTTTTTMSSFFQKARERAQEAAAQFQQQHSSEAPEGASHRT